MSVKANTIIKWIDQELPPLSWGVISIKLMKVFVQNNISPRAIDDNTMFNDEIVKQLQELIKKTYNKDMPIK